jgi:hypothetical protein
MRYRAYQGVLPPERGDMHRKTYLPKDKCPAKKEENTKTTPEQNGRRFSE